MHGHHQCNYCTAGTSTCILWYICSGYIVLVRSSLIHGTPSHWICYWKHAISPQIEILVTNHFSSILLQSEGRDSKQILGKLVVGKRVGVQSGQGKSSSQHRCNGCMASTCTHFTLHKCNKFHNKLINNINS